MNEPSINQTYFYKLSVLTPALQEMLIEQNFQWHITANFNRVTTPSNGRDKLKAWSSFIDRKLLGRNYYKKPDDQRLFFVAIPEVGAGSIHLHYHLLAKLPESRHEQFPLIAESTWKHFVPEGSLYVQRIANTAEDLKRVVAYDTKDIWKQNNFDNLFFSTEFSSQQKEATK